MASGYVNRRNAEPVDPAIRTTHVLFALPTFTSHLVHAASAAGSL
jgi:hypothetical protein